MKHLSANKWRSLTGAPVPDILEEVRKRNLENKYTIHIGTDSKQYSFNTVIVTTICFREKGYGVIVFFQRNEIPNFTNIPERLIHETIVSLECAELLRTEAHVSPSVHLDINTRESARSTRILSAASGMVEGMGFPVSVKPDAWAADIADMFTR